VWIVIGALVIVAAGAGAFVVGTYASICSWTEVARLEAAAAVHPPDFERGLPPTTR